MSIEIITVVLFLCALTLMALGLPIAFAFGGTAVLFIALLWSVKGLFLVPYTAFNIGETLVWIAVPLFILMGCILERSGIAENLYTMMYGIIGRLKGGLASGTVFICTIFAAMAGISGAATTTMGIVALPSMLKRSYNKDIAIGCIAAGGALGILIPPSCPMIIYGLFAQESVGRLFAAGLLPGLILSALFVSYITIRSYLQPNMGPAVPPEEAYGFKQSLASAKALILPLILITFVLGSIFSGIATPTEASAVGAFGSIFCAIVNGKFSWSLFVEAVERTLRVTAMLLWIALGALIFSSVYIALGAPELLRMTLQAWQINPWLIVVMMQATLLVMGCFMDTTAILVLSVPLYVPLIKSFGFDPVWFGILFIINMEMAFLTPPFGINLFYLRAIVPSGITMGDIYRSVWEFVALQIIGLAIIMIFPQTALWLPNQIYGIVPS